MTTSAKSVTIKLQTNVPLVGVLQYVDFAKSKTEGWADQICLKGHFDGHGEGRVYLSDWLAKPMLENGLIETNGLDRDGNQAYKVLYKGRVQILREENGPKKFTTILPLDASTPAAGAVSPPPATSPGRAPAESPRSNSVAAPVSGPPSPDSEPWRALAAQYKRAAGIAIRTWAETINDEQALVAAAATVFIEANKRGLTVPPTAKEQAEEIRRAFDQPPAPLAKAIAGEEDDDLPF